MQRFDDPSATFRHAGAMLRDWRHRRHLTQRALASSTGLSLRALGTLETGRLLPSRDMVLRLAERLEVPLRDCNAILFAAGYDAPFAKGRLGDPMQMGVWTVVEQAMRAHTPHPVLALDRNWGIAASNDALKGLIAGVEPGLLALSPNWARIMLHPAGLAPRIVNLRDWRDHITLRLRRRFDASLDTDVADLLEEMADFPEPPATAAVQPPDPIAVPLRLMTVDGLLSFYCVSSRFESAVDVALAELTIETLYPVDAETESIMRQQREVARPATAG